MKAKVILNKATSQERVVEFDVPEMSGTEKQVKWAVDIFVDTVCGLLNMVGERINEPEIRTKYEEYLNVLSSQTSASWWINHRGLTWGQIYKEILNLQ